MSKHKKWSCLKQFYNSILLFLLLIISNVFAADDIFPINGMKKSNSIIDNVNSVRYNAGDNSENDFNKNINDIENQNNDNNNVNNNKSITEFYESVIVGEKILRAIDSPYILRTDLFVENGAKLVIEPGVIIYFAPMVGITIHGSIYAIGNPEQEVIFTSQPQSEYVDRVHSDPLEFGIRLVDGPSPLQGRLQIYHSSKWISVCSNSRNWTIQDYETVCRQMGYQGGQFWNWVERLSNFEPRLLLEQPKCRGTENKIFECAWNSRQLGSGVCDYHSDIGIQCLPLHETSLVNWRGLKFENAVTSKVLASDNTVYESISQSHLKYVQIVNAGSGRGRSATAAIDVIGTPPVLDHVTVDHSAYTGINVTRSNSAFVFRDVTVRRSKGFGIFVNSSYGLARFENCNVTENGADGIRYIRHDLRSDERTDRSSVNDFCTLPTTDGQTYPVSVFVQQSYYSVRPKTCDKYFYTKRGYVLTVDFVYFVIKQNDTANIEVYDGYLNNDKLIASWLIRNSTRPQSVTSTSDRIFIRFTAEPRAEMLGYLRLTTGYHKSYDLNVTRSVIADNGGRGIAVDNMRSQIHVHDSSVSNNGHVAGVHITSGSGDVNITQSRIAFNIGSGINITYYGGNRNISKSSLSSNYGYGLAVWLNETVDKDRQEYLAFNQTTVVEYSKVIRNHETGILHGNYSGNFWVNITANWFNDSRSNGIDIQTCWFERFHGEQLNLQIGHNTFENSQKNAIIIYPALNILGKIEHNQFRFGKYGAILIKTQPWEEFGSLPAQLVIQHNQFNKNEGLYVVSMGLSPIGNDDKQSILFTKNFLRNNKVKEPFGNSDDGTEGIEGSGHLNPRSRVAAVVVISSAHVDIFRNIISNIHSKYEIGSQLSDQSKTLNCTYNWLGHAEEHIIFSRIFHRNDRYNLAQIQYLPYLLHNTNPSASTIIDQSRFVPTFYTEGSDRIGGEVDGKEVIPAGVYTVERDINIRPGGELILQPGVTLSFEPSVGMLIAGMLQARGRHPDDILFTLKRSAIVIPENDTNEAMILDEGENLDMDTEAVINVNEIPEVPVRLLGGNNNHEGRLQVYMDGRWGTVCDYGWTLLNAALVCHQLGFPLNPSDWRLQRSELPNSGTTEEVILSNVRCTEHDIDITKCRAERLSRGEFENSCSHENDVGIRCYDSAWAGVRFGILARRANLQYTTIEKAGLFDYTTNIFKPALQMDFARHNLENVRIVNNLHDGLGIIYSDVFGGDSINNVKHSEFSNNKGNGISLKQLGLQISRSVIERNLASGITHDPVIAANDQRDLSGGFQTIPDYNNIDSDFETIYLPDNTMDISLETRENKHIITKRVIDTEVERKLTVYCRPGFVIGIQLLNPIENRSTEDIQILDSQSESNKAHLWKIKRDLSVFPVTSSSYGVIIYYKSGLNALGGAVLMVSALQAPVQNIPNKIVRGPIPTLLVRSSKIQKNKIGISATYYNRYLGERGEHYLRKANESIRIVSTEISQNEQEAVFIHAPFWDVHVSNLSEISIHINSSMIMKNGRGIRHRSRDLRSSNNLFHYVLKDTTIEENQNGGLDISLPYVWQYNENFTHSVYLENDTWTRNNNFEITIGGHYAIVNISSNVFTENECNSGLIAIRGMEKKLKIDNNRIMKNNGRHIFEFRADSLSEIMGTVPAILKLNEIRNNNYNPRAMEKGSHMRSKLIKYKPYPTDPTSVIMFGGLQKVQIYRNLIAGNKMDYDLLAGIRTARLNNFLLAKENWWGSKDPDYILSKIFDFDDWNNYAEVMYLPYLIEDSFEASVSVSYSEKRPVDLDNIGGRIYDSLTLGKREKPYVIRSDITVMPDAVLTLTNGVEMLFPPNVGILVLGTLIARGYSDSEIVMRAIETSSDSLDRVERSVEYMVAQDTIRLCTGQNCSSNENEVDAIKEGFLEYFNHTTLQWVPICDRRFTERNAQVVCRELGYSSLDIYFGHDHRIEFHTNSLTRIWSWVEPLECRGDESHLALCPERLNGQLYGRRHECHWNDKFVFVSCNGDPEAKSYWGGIRFANANFEQNLYEFRLHDIHTHGTIKKQESQLEYVRIESAGMLHNERSPAIQAIHRNPSISSVTIKDCVHHGINLISPDGAIYMHHLKIDNVLGNGINTISLTGEGRESDESSFTPLKALDLPYHLFSMIDICDTTKEITIEERVLIYYKYDNNPVNCVKILNTVYRSKPLGFRLLQGNLFNHSKEYGRRDAIHLYDGDIYNITSIFVGSIEADTDNHKQLFRTTSPTMSIRLIASGAPSTHGFIAEIVTLPISAIGFNRDAQHNISYSEISRSTRGAITYVTAGEVSPILTLEWNRILNNCRQLYGNFSTCSTAVSVDVQNMQTFHFRNNLVKDNQGGLYIRSDSRGSATSLRGWIHHNLFTRNRNRPSIQIEGRQSSPYQEVTLYQNYISQNDAVYEDVMRLRQVVSNFTYNYVHSNYGGRILEISGFDKVRLPIYQTTSHNSFYDNVATDWRGRATIVAGTAGQHYVDNIFRNLENDYEIITVNRSITIDIWKTKIDATHNYWSFNETISVGSRVRDRSDDPQLLDVQYIPFHMNNKTILDGKCPPGWSLLVDTCYMYVGAPMTFYEAKEFCRSDNASVPFIRVDSNTLWMYLQKQMVHLRYPESVWVQDLNYIEKCTSFDYNTIEIEDCENKHSFICEIDPKVEVETLFWKADIFTIGMIVSFLLVIILLGLIGFCWFAKSRHRQIQRLERRNSIRQSLRSLNSIDPQGSIRRRNFNMSNSTNTLTKSTATDYKKMTSNGSIDSMDKSVLSSEASYDTGYDIQNSKQNEYVVSHNDGAVNDILSQKYNDYANKAALNPMKTATVSSGRLGIKPKAYGLPEYNGGPGFELSYRNEGFRDNSTFSGTRNNSISTNLTEDTPIIQQIETDDVGSDYYGNSSTLPLRTNDNLTFLTELKQRLPEYESPKSSAVHSSFLPPPMEPMESTQPEYLNTSTLPYDKKIDQFNFTPTDDDLREIEMRIPQKPDIQPIDMRRPDSYYTAVRSSRAPASMLQQQYKLPTPPTPPMQVQLRPKTLYEAAESPRPSYTRSKSEALLETNFDENAPSALQADSRSYSQPLETAM